MEEIKEEMMKFVYTEQLKKTTDEWDAKEHAFHLARKQREANVALDNKSIFFFPSNPNPRAYLKADAFLIARKTTVAHATVWRWGYTFEATWKGAIVPEKDIVLAMSTTLPALQKSAILAFPKNKEEEEEEEEEDPENENPDVCCYIIIATLAQELKFDYIEEAKLGPNPNERYVLGLRNLQWNIDLALPHGIERVVDVVQQGLIRANDIHATLHSSSLPGPPSDIQSVEVVPL
jgi:hypothetical protein